MGRSNLIKSKTNSVNEIASSCYRRIRNDGDFSSLRVFCEAKDEAISLTIPNREIASLLATLAPRNDGVWDSNALAPFYKWIAMLRATRSARNDGVGSATRSARNDETLMARILSLPPIVFIGKISYSLYLWHWIVIVFYKRYHLIHYDTPLNATDYAIMTILSFAAAIISYYAIEKPCRFNSLNLKRSFLLFYVVPAFIISAVFVTHKINPTKFYGFFSKELGERHALHTTARAYAGSAPHICHSKIVLNKNGDECIFGDVSKPPKVLMVGDSHAGHYTHLIDQAGQLYGFSAKIKSVDGCLPLDKNLLDKSGMCADLARDFWGSVGDFEVVIIAQYWAHESREQFIKNDLANALDELSKMGKKVVLLAQVPELRQLLYDRYLYGMMKGEIRTGKEILSGAEKAQNEFVKNLAKGRAMWFAPLDDLSESTKASFPFYNGLVMYKDDDHLNEFGIRQIADEVLPKQKEFWEGLVR